MARSGSGSRMNKPCDSCKRYLEHLDQKNQTKMSCFLRHMDASSKHSMIVPKEFVKNFAGKLSGWISLESPNGSLYDVEATKHDSETVFQHGWEAFVDANHIEENDFVLLRYIEKSRFEVLILDSDGCEKVFSCAGIRNTPNIDQGRIVKYVGISSSFCHDTTESSGSERLAKHARSSPNHNGRTAKMSAASSSFEESGEDTPGNRYFESDDLQTPPRADYILSRRSYLSEAQRERVIALIQEIKPETTVFVAIMKKNSVQQRPGPYLVVSKEYALAHFPRDTTRLTLQRPGKSKKWHPILYIRRDRTLYMLRGQWLDFVRENYVQEGDMCLLLPKKSGKHLTLIVYLLRAPSTSSMVGPSHGRSCTNMTSAVHIKGKSTCEEHTLSERATEEISDGSLNSKDFGGFSESPYILSRRNCLSQSEKKIVEAKVRAIQSEFPVYVSTMGKSNVAVSKPMLEFSAKYAGAHLPGRKQTVVLQRGREIWKTKMVITNGCRRFLRGGWPEFVCDNSLRTGDICLFELKKNERELTMEVHIISTDQGALVLAQVE